MSDNNDMQKQLNENTVDIAVIKETLKRLESNHISHIEADMLETKESIKSMDKKMWFIMLALVSATILSGLGMYLN
jgi:hypothetical protein